MTRTHSATRNRYDAHELGGAFGDLGTLIPFIAAYIAVLRMDASAVLLGFGVALVVVGLVYRTPFPVQPMKAIGTIAVGHSAGVAVTGSIVVGAGVVTAAIWLALALTGTARRAAQLIPRPALLGVILGLGFSFMVEGARLMATSPWLGGILLIGTLAMLAQSRFPAMLALLPIGFVISFLQKPELVGELAAIELGLELPSLAWTGLGWNDLWLGAIYLALPQLPMTFGNALIAITEENNRQFPERPVTERQVALSTGLLNVWASAIGGVPMCHGAGGMAGHVQFGARTGGASVMLGIALVALAVLLGDSIGLLLAVFPEPVLGVILFLAGAQLALGSKEPGPEKMDRYLMLTTAGLTMWNAGFAILFGLIGYHGFKRGWFRI